MRDTLIQASYLVASVLFILGLRSLTRPDKARSGMQMAAVGMLFAIAGTLLNHTIVDYRWIAGGLVLGVVIGYPMGMWVPMTAMPQRIALSLTLSALAATLVGVAEYYTEIHAGTVPTHGKMIALAFEIMLGSITVGGTIVAAGKLQEWLPSKPLTFAGQNLVNALVFLGVLALAAYSIADPTQQWAFYSMIAVSVIFGVTLVLPIGGADMPVVVALLNSYSGLASCATGFAIGNVILIISGSLDGAAGFILSILMSKAMNRSFTNVLFGAFGSETTAVAGKSAEGLSVRSIGVEDAAIQRALANFQGVERRMQHVADTQTALGHVTIVDDYGHHPTEVAATLEALRQGYPGRRLVLAFQPHRYTRTHDLIDDFGKVLSTVDVLLVTEVYAAGESPIAGADGRAICRAVRSRGQVEPLFVDKVEELAQSLKDVIRDNDVIVTMGAGNITTVSHGLPERFAELLPTGPGSVK